MGSGRMLDHGGRGRDGVRFWRECTPCHQTKAVPGAHRTASSVLLIKWLAPFGTDLCSAERETIPFTADHADGHRCQPSFQRFPCLPAFPASSLPSVKRIGFLAAVFPSASSACSCKMDWILTPRSVPWDRICPTVAGTMAAGCSPTQSEPSSTREKPALPKAQ